MRGITNVVMTTERVQIAYVRDCLHVPETKTLRYIHIYIYCGSFSKTNKYKILKYNDTRSILIFFIMIKTYIYI